MDAFDNDEATVELSFSPNARLVATVRRFVSHFYSQILQERDTSRITVATHELLENSVRYSSDGTTTIRIVVHRAPAAWIVTIDTRNRASAANLESVKGALDEMAAARDAQEHYQKLLRRNIKSVDVSGLGLGRVHAESGMDLSYQIHGDTLHLRAQARFASGATA